VVDQTNWEKAQGLLPEPVLNWLKQGEFALAVDELDFTVSEYLPKYVQEAHKTNTGKYGLSKDGAIIDVGTGKPPQYVLGVPFPELDADDPRVAEKILHNNKYVQYSNGDFHAFARAFWVGQSGVERSVEYEVIQIAMDGHPGVVELSNPKRIEKYTLIVLRNPFDVAGTAVLLWRFLDPTKEDLNFGYIPAIRRTRRMSPANRSDAFIGADLCVDDTNGYDGKIPAFTWKLLRTQEAIMPWVDAGPARIVQNQAGEWETTKSVKPVVYGYQKDGWQGTPWLPVNLVWAKRRVYVIEAEPKDPYYNYGTQYMWLDTQTFGCSYKVINDRSGKYWKTLLTPDWVCVSEDQETRFRLGGVNAAMIDDRTDHATVANSASPSNKYVFFADLDQEDFTLGGFQKYCK
jgi:hypothetical protein